MKNAINFNGEKLFKAITTCSNLYPKFYLKVLLKNQLLLKTGSCEEVFRHFLLSEEAMEFSEDFIIEESIIDNNNIVFTVLSAKEELDIIRKSIAKYSFELNVKEYNLVCKYIETIRN